MTNKNDNHNDKKHEDKQDHSGKQGFASMDKEKVKKIASKGGQTSHKGENHDDDDNDHNNKSKSHDEKNDHGKDTHDNKHNEEHHGKQGFTSMDKEKVKEIASKGGQASHKNSHDNDSDE